MYVLAANTIRIGHVLHFGRAAPTLGQHRIVLLLSVLLFLYAAPTSTAVATITVSLWLTILKHEFSKRYYDSSSNPQTTTPILGWVHTCNGARGSAVG